MKIEVECYGVTARHTGQSKLALEMESANTVADVLYELGHRYTELAPMLRQCAVGMGDSLVQRNHPIKDGDVLALLPPVAGG